MAEKKLKYQGVFSSQDGNTYAINLYEEGYTGQVIPLTLSDEPFVTREDDTDDAFASIRGQNGYIRVIDTNGTLFNSIIPPNNTHLMVKVYAGTYQGGTFTPSTLRWQGFVESGAYTQQWTGCKTVLELPVISMLTALQYVYFPQDGSVNIPVRQAITMGMDALYDYAAVWSVVLVMTDWVNKTNILWDVYLQYTNVQDEVEYVSALNNRLVVYEGRCFYDVLAEICQLFGMTMRENADSIIFEQIHKRTSDTGKSYSIQSLRTDTPASYSYSFADRDFNFQFASTDNKMTIIQGKRKGTVVLSFEDKRADILHLPESIEDTTPVDEVSVGSVRLVVQCPARPSAMMADYGSEEHNAWQTRNGATVYQFVPDANFLGETSTDISVGSTVSHIYLEDAGEWHDAVQWDSVFNSNEDQFVWDGTKWCDFLTYPSVEEQIRETSIFKAPMNFPIFEPYTQPSSHGDYLIGWPTSICHIRYGAIPVRFWIGGVNERPELRHGMYYNLNYQPTADLVRIKSPIAYNGKNGEYLNLNMVIHLFDSVHPGESGPSGPMGEWVWKWDYISWEIRYNKLKAPEYVFLLKWGHKYWNGTEWTTTESTFTLQFADNKIPENFEESFNVDDVGGYYIPVEEGLTGTIEFSLRSCNSWNGTETGALVSGADVHAAIMEDLEVTILQQYDVTASDVKENNYYTGITESGFKDDVEISLGIGTNNNNEPCTNMILGSDGMYMEEIKYNDNVDRRPEISLTLYLKNYYNKIRMVYEAWIKQSAITSWALSRISYGGKWFYAIVSQKEWRTGKEKIKLIETNNEYE